MFVDIISIKDIFNHSEFVQIEHAPRENMRKKGFSPINLLRGSAADDFSRSANTYIFLHRYSLISLKDTKIK